MGKLTSEKMRAPSTALSMKFALVLITDTLTVELASVRARVNSPHITALKAMFMRKKNCAHALARASRTT